MIVAPLAGRPQEAVRVALLSCGWEGDLARSTAAGLESLAFRVDGLSESAMEALVRLGGKLGLEIVSGEGWILVAGGRARLAALARPWIVPEPLAELAMALGRALPAEEPRVWQTARGPIPLDVPVLVGILNVTPDSFSDGGRLTDVDLAVARAEAMFAAGARVLDIGGESTRPGAEPVPEAEERRRVIPVIAAIARRLPAAVLSIDTVKSGVARAAIDSGAAVVNDVSGLRLDPLMGGVVAELGAGLVLMHSRGSVADMASLDHAEYPRGVLPEVMAELGGALERAYAAGIPAERIVLDPGLGFGKSAEQNLELLRGLEAFRALGRPVLVGPSRKRFLGAVTGRAVGERDVATAGASVTAWINGARLFRVHEPAAVRDALLVAAAIHPA
ncbi:MAG: dihydropteroate synthase [Gemmatimonadales bacterium]